MKKTSPAEGHNRCVILLSGGLDSATVLALAKASGRDLYAMSFRYGQKQSVELERATALARDAGCILHRIVNLEPTTFEGSSLTEAGMPVAADDGAPSSTIPSTYVPARNLLFLSYALAWAESLKAEEIHIGVNAIDYSGYPDCRSEFIEAFERLANLATAAAVERRIQFRICTPLLALTKAQIIRAGTALGVDYAKTHSCYDPSQDGRACGRCAACSLRRDGFRAAKISDPTLYA